MFGGMRACSYWDFSDRSRRLVGSFKLCLDETGRYERGIMLRSTGVPGYDAKIAKEMMGWTYRPYVVDGVAIPICSGVTFIYNQHRARGVRSRSQGTWSTHDPERRRTST